jgi:hypothetical protein
VQGFGAGITADFDLFQISVDGLFESGSGRGAMSLTQFGSTTEGGSEFDLQHVFNGEAGLQGAALRYTGP